MGGVDVERVEGRKGYPHNTERETRGGGRKKDRKRHRWKKEKPCFPLHLTIYVLFICVWCLQSISVFLLFSKLHCCLNSFHVDHYRKKYSRV